MTPIERLQTALNGLGLKAIEARLEGMLEQASKKDVRRQLLFPVNDNYSSRSTTTTSFTNA